MTEKVKLKIKRVEDEQTPDGIPVYKMTLQSKRGTYIRGVTVADWEEEHNQRSIRKTWLRDIGKIEAAKEIIKAKTKDELKAEMKAKIKDIEGLELKEDE